MSCFERSKLGEFILKNLSNFNQFRYSLDIMEKAPTLLFGLFFALGAGFFYCTTLPLAILILSSLYLFDKRLLCIGCILFGFSIAYIKEPPKCTLDLPKHMSGTFAVKRSKLLALPFGNSLMIEGTFDHWPCTMFLSGFANPKMDGSYHLSGTLKKSELGKLTFKPDKKQDWKKIKGTVSFAGLRHKIKKSFKKYLHTQIPSKSVSNFFGALLTGEMESFYTRFHFAKLGLQHILAISGFHFALIAALLGLILKRIFPIRWAYSLLLIILTLYAFLLGDTPSVMRAYFMIALYLVGLLIGRKSSSLNALGTALSLELFLYPSHVTHLGFLLSYSATFSIFLLYPLIDAYLGRILPMRTKIELEAFKIIDRYGYIASMLIRKGLALNFAVNIPTSLIILAAFGKFSLLSLLYNLFIPPMLTLSMGLAIIGLLLGPLGKPVHILNAWLTELLLELVRYPPEPMNLYLKTTLVTPSVCLLMLSALAIALKMGLNPSARKQKIGMDA